MIDQGKILLAGDLTEKRYGENGNGCTASGPMEESAKILLEPKMANRHGFICGATGTGKTVTLKVLAESFSALGVPVFVSDVKGDVSGLAQPGTDSEKIQERVSELGLTDFSFRGCPVSFFDLYGASGVPIRTTISEIGPLLLAGILDLNDTQTDLLAVIFKMADDHGLLLTDTKDLKAVLNYAAENAAELEMEYGHIAKATVSTVIRSIVSLEAEGGDRFFGEPAIDIRDFFVRTAEGAGMISILDARTLVNRPRLYSAFMLYFLSELFETLPEIGDPEKPKLAFFFDEAHLLFHSASKTLLEKIAQIVRLIRSRGVSIWFVTQSPSDIPSEVLGQLSNRIEHALRAYTPAELKAVKAAAEAFRENPAFRTEELLQQLGTGEALVSLLDDKGIPGIARYARILPPCCSLDPVSEESRQDAVSTSIYQVKYGTAVDGDSAYELLMRRRQAMAEEDGKAEQERLNALAAEKQEAEEQKALEKQEKEAEKARIREEKEAAKQAEKEAKEAAKQEEKKQKAVKQAAKSITSTVTGTVGRQIGKSLGSTLGGSFGKTLGGNLGASLGRNIFGTLFKL